VAGENAHNKGIKENEYLGQTEQITTHTLTMTRSWDNRA